MAPVDQHSRAFSNQVDRTMAAIDLNNGQAAKEHLKKLVQMVNELKSENGRQREEFEKEKEQIKEKHKLLVQYLEEQVADLKKENEQLKEQSSQERPRRDSMGQSI